MKDKYIQWLIILFVAGVTALVINSQPPAELTNYCQGPSCP
jgi:hypothetical protein